MTKAGKLLLGELGSYTLVVWANFEAVESASLVLRARSRRCASGN